MSTIRTAVIGTGFIGPGHIEALRRVGGVEVTAVASLDLEQARGVASRFGIPKVTSSWEEVVNDPEIDVVHNCTPNNLHFLINRAVIQAGKHIVSEKPLTMTSRESAELLSMLRNSSVVNAVNFNYRFYPLVQHARSLVSNGTLGEIYLVHGHYLQDWLYYETDFNWRLEPGLGGPSRAVADIGSHWCDLVQFITGLRVTSVCADLVTIHPTRKKPARAALTFKGEEKVAAGKMTNVRISTEDAGTVLLRFANGAHGALVVSQVSAGRKNREWIEIDGSRMAIAWDQEEPNTLWIGHREKANEVLMKDPSLLDPAARQFSHYPGGHPEGYPDGPKNLFMKVYAFIRERKDPRRHRPDFPTFEDGHRETAIVEAVMKSNARETWVDVDVE